MLTVMLRHPLLSQSQRLNAASENSPSMQHGETGNAVVRLQLALLSCGAKLPTSTKKQTAMPDGLFGQETAAGLREVQRANGLIQDGIAGRKTLAKLDALLPPPPPQPKEPCCGNCTPGNRRTEGDVERMFAGANFRGVTAAMVALPGGVTLPTGLRFLTTAQVSTATSVFGFSLDFTRIILSNATGLAGRPFTVHIKLLGLDFVVINAGTFSPSRDLLIHELTHAWQSQHSINPKQFMVNSIESQGIAEALSALGSDASAYYFKPGRAFGLYGAEQIACQVEKGVASIVGVVKLFPPFIPQPLNELSLSVPHWEVRGPGVDTSC